MIGPDTTPIGAPDTNFRIQGSSMTSFKKDWQLPLRILPDAMFIRPGLSSYSRRTRS
jgi:hypothetical protein